MNKRVLGIGAGVALLVLMATPGAVSAEHTHAMHLGNGDCVVLAKQGGEKYVELPPAVFARNPNADIAAAPGRNHPLHVLVHQGVPGEHRTIQVFGSAGDTCEEYVNAADRAH